MTEFGRGKYIDWINGPKNVATSVSMMLLDNSRRFLVTLRYEVMLYSLVFINALTSGDFYKVLRRSRTIADNRKLAHNSIFVFKNVNARAQS